MTSNHTDFPSILVPQKILQGDKKKDQTDEDPIREIMLLKDVHHQEDDTSKIMTGYIQCITVFPFTVIAYTDKQL